LPLGNHGHVEAKALPDAAYAQTKPFKFYLPRPQGGASLPEFGLKLAPSDD